MGEKVNELDSSSINKSLWKMMSIIRKIITPVIVVALMSSCSGSKTKTIQVWEWTTLSSIVKDSLWLSEDITSDPTLCRILIENIAEQNNINDINKINVNDTLIINMDSVNNIINRYQADSKQWNTKEKKESIENASYITINSEEEFKNSTDYLIKKIYKDETVRWKFIQTLNDGYSIKFLKPRETKNSPSLSVDSITKPKDTIWDELKDKKFVLDPGHWSLDVWAIGLVQYWDESNKEKVVVYEGALMMDLTYRIARELRAHWAEVELTHYMNRRWILDVKDLPPCSRVFDSEWNEIYQDIWNNTNQDSEWTLFNGSGKYLTKRSNIANSYEPNLFISLHADILRKNGKIDDQSKILSIKYDERQENQESKEIGQRLLDNGFWYYFNWKLVDNVERDTAQQHLWVLKPTKSPAILIEFWNISQESQAYILREPTKREELAKNFVSSLIKSL